jgi:hypothetical protein
MTDDVVTRHRRGRARAARQRDRAAVRPGSPGGASVIFGREPAAIAAVIAIAINLAISFGLHLTTEQVALINTLAVAILGLIVRQSSTPVNAPAPAHRHGRHRTRWR